MGVVAADVESFFAVDADAGFGVVIDLQLVDQGSRSGVQDMLGDDAGVVGLGRLTVGVLHVLYTLHLRHNVQC